MKIWCQSHDGGRFCLHPTFRQIVSSVHTPKRNTETNQNLHPTKQCRNSMMRRMPWRNSKLLGAWLTTLALSAAIWLEFRRSITNWPLHKGIRLVICTCILVFSWFPLSVSFRKQEKQLILLGSLNCYLFSWNWSSLTWKRYKSPLHINTDCTNNQKFVSLN